MEVSFLVHLPAHQQGQQVVIHAELFIDLVKVGVLPLHEQIDLFFCHHHLQQVGFQAAHVVKKIDILKFCGSKTDKPHVELAHGGVVVVHFRDQDFVDVLKIDAGRKALLRAE